MERREKTYIRPPDPGGTFIDEPRFFDMNNQNDSSKTTEKVNFSKGGETSRCKRRRPDSPLHQPERTTVKPKYKFLIIKRTNGESMTKISPFLIDKILTQIAGNKSIKTAKKLRDGSMLVETFTYEQAEKLMTRLPENDMISVTVEPHRSLNKVKGIVTCYDLDCVDIEEVKEQLREQGVEDVIRINKRIDNMFQPTHSYIVIFGLTTLPEKLKIGYLRVQVRPYIPLPFRCHNCHRFNHGKATCKNEATCPGCGEPVHDNDCKSTRCVNCNGDHPSTDRNCPRWQIEKKIAEVRTLEKISYNEAKNKVKISQAGLFTKPYSELLKGNNSTQSPSTSRKPEMKDQGTQCSLPEVFHDIQEVQTKQSKEIKTTLDQVKIIKKETFKNKENGPKESTIIKSKVDNEKMWANQWNSDSDQGSTISSQSGGKTVENDHASNAQDKIKNTRKSKKKKVILN